MKQLQNGSFAEIKFRSSLSKGLRGFGSRAPKKKDLGVLPQPPSGTRPRTPSGTKLAFCAKGKTKEMNYTKNKSFYKKEHPPAIGTIVVKGSRDNVPCEGLGAELPRTRKEIPSQ